MPQSTNSGVVMLTVTREAAHFILDCVADRPFKQVAPLLSELQAQMQFQANTQPAAEGGNDGQKTEDHVAGPAALEPQPGQKSARLWSIRKPATAKQTTAGADSAD